MSKAIEAVARAICKSATCEGINCCQWPANMSRCHNCPVSHGAYDDAAKAAIEVLRIPTDEMLSAGCASHPEKPYGLETTLVDIIRAEYMDMISAALK